MDEIADSLRQDEEIFDYHLDDIADCLGEAARSAQLIGRSSAIHAVSISRERLGELKIAVTPQRTLETQKLCHTAPSQYTLIRRER